MKTFVIEREIPGARSSRTSSCAGSPARPTRPSRRSSKPYTWLHSYVAGDKVYCVHQAENAEVIREHAKRGDFPANLVAEVANVFDSTGPRELPV